jgi:hypothetical protein
MKMKNKKSEQIEKKEKHREQLKLSKQRSSEPDLSRIEPFKTEKQKFLIYCEGKNTEPSYFEQFRLSNAKVIAFGNGYNTVSLVERAYKLSQNEDYDQVWCVYDKDDFHDFNDSIFLADKYKALLEGKYKFEVVYSNQAFEYWLIMHFEDHQGGQMHRDDYYDKLNSYLIEFGLKYDKDSKIVTEGIFTLMQTIIKKRIIRVNGSRKEIFLSRQDIAIERAKKIYDRLEHKNPAIEESSTTVFKLVEELIKYQ